MRHSTGRLLLTIVLPIIAVGCADVPTAPTPQAIASLDAPASKATAVVVASRPRMMVQPTLTLTVTPDGDRDRVRASIGGIVGVSFYPGAGEKMPPNPLNGTTAGSPSPFAATAPCHGGMGAHGCGPSR